MNTRLVVGMVALSLLVTGFAPVPPPKDPATTPAGRARKQLEGNWVVRYTETPLENQSGRRGGPSFRVGSRIKITGDKWSSSSREPFSRESRGTREGNIGGRSGRSGAKGKGPGGEYLLTVDPRRSPMTLDLRRPTSENVSIFAVYQLEGNTLRLCLVDGRSELPRPQTLEPRPEAATLVILDRVKP